MSAPVPNLSGTGFVPPEVIKAQLRPPRHRVLSDEGFRLFFPLAALHAALWPFLWVAVQDHVLIGSNEIAPSVWHMHEMIFGAFGAALMGFLTTAWPEWTDTPPLRGRWLWGLAGIWGLARIVGLLGLDPLTPLAMICDLAWIAALWMYGLRLSLQTRSDTLWAFLIWLAAFGGVGAMIRMQMILGDSFAAGEAAKTAGLVFLGVLGLALSRITVPVSNLVLDPSGETSPFRPHPGRLNLATGLVALVIGVRLCGASDAVTGWIFIAAGAAFLDRVAEGFVGREMLRTEILILMAPSAFAGAGLIWLGAAGLGAPLTTAGGWHVALMGGLGFAVLAVMSISGLFHTGHKLPLPRAVSGAMVLLLASLLLRIAPEVDLMEVFFAHVSASVFWAAGFALWLWYFLPIFADPDTLGDHDGC